MIFEDIFSGTLSFDMTTFLSALLIVAAAFAAILLSTLIQKATDWKNISFIKNLFSIATLLSVLSALFFGTAAIKNNDGPRKKEPRYQRFYPGF